MDSKPDEAKPAKPAGPTGPFLLEVTPNELVMPPTGNLEVKIRNPTEETYEVYVYFDSFFWLMKVENEDFNVNRGESNSMCFHRKLLKPKEVLTFTIGHHNATYKERVPSWIYNSPFGRPYTEPETTENVPPCKRKTYNYERPEGVLLIRYADQRDARECSDDCECANHEKFHKSIEEGRLDKFPMKMMDLHLKEETEEYKKYREQYAEIRKEQARRARWGHLLVNEDGLTLEKFRDFDGKVRKFGRIWDWDRGLPSESELKESDAFSDGEILGIRRERKKNYNAKMKEDQEMIEKWDRDDKEAKERMEKKEEEEKKKEEEERIKEDEEEKKRKEEEAAAPKEKSKVKTVEKSKRPEERPQKVPTPPKPKSTKSKVSVAPPKGAAPPTNKKSFETPNVAKNKKKKKANPCCSVM